MRQLIAAAIDSACRRALYVWLGLRIPAARIRHEDISQMRQHAEDRVLRALGEAAHWNKEIDRLNAKVSGAGTASAGLPGYAGDNNGERK